MKIQYKININSILKCEKYCEFIEQFHFAGYIHTGKLWIEKEDIQRIVENCLFKDVELVIGCISEEDKEPVKHYLEVNGLFSN